MSAVGPNRGRGKLPTFVNGFGDNELEAIAFASFTSEGGEQWVQDMLGLSLAGHELEDVIGRSPASVRGRRTGSCFPTRVCRF